MSPVTGASASPRLARITIDADALRHNLHRVKQFAPDSRVMAVIKADAYGHGVLETARALKMADAFAVSMPGEAIELRRAGITKPVVILQGFTDEDELGLIADYDAEPVINQAWQVDVLEQSRGLKVPVWLKIDTGMHRLGVPVEMAEELYQRLQACKQASSVRIMSHFANADDPSNTYNNNQLEAFLKVRNRINTEASIANSAALIAFPESRLQWVRPGIMLYGSSPLLDKSARELDLLPAMNFESRLLAVRDLKRGDAVGYGSIWTCPEDMTMGVVAAGYADGYPRHAISGTPVWINGSLCPLVGRVSMDSICVDLRGVDARPGDRAVLWGKELSVDEVARMASTIGYELLCSAGNACR